jgi:aspartyl-tRNA(Asn)/glutamyl-tRNA(Gln) amidotransferase subunit A
LITQLTAAEISRELQARNLSAVEVTTAFLDRIQAVDEAYGAFLRTDRVESLAAAESAQRRLDAGEAGPLTGVPLALKDNLSTRGLETT